MGSERTVGSATEGSSSLPLPSRFRIPPFTVHRPKTPAEAAHLLATLGPRVAALGGGIDLINRLKRAEPVDHLVALRGIDDLRTIELDGSLLRVGAAATHREFAEHDDVRCALPQLATLWRTLGHPRVRAVGTLGGNLAAGVLQYDVAPLVAAASARLVYQDEERRLLARIDFPVRPRRVLRYASSYKPIAAVAVAVEPSGPAEFRCRVVVSCAYPRLASTDFAAPDDADAAAFIAIRGLAGDGQPELVDDHVASAGYRSHLMGVLIRRLLDQAIAELHDTTPGD